MRKKHFHSKTFAILTLFCLLFNLSLPVFAGEIKNVPDLTKTLMQKIGEKDEKGFANVVLNNKELSKKFFYQGINEMSASLKKGVPSDNKEIKVLHLMCILVAAVFNEKLHDKSLAKSYDKFADKWGVKNKNKK